MIAIFQLEDRVISRANQLEKLAEIDGLGIEGKIIPEKVEFMFHRRDGFGDFVTTSNDGELSSPVSIPMKYIIMDDEEFNKFYSEAVK